MFLFAFLIFVTEPLRHVLLVYWVYGKDAYLHGLRVIPRKPHRFSNGILVPQIIDIVTASGMFFATTLGLSLALSSLCAYTDGILKNSSDYYFSLAGLKSRAAEFMQYRSPVGAGPSSNTCPKCASHRAQRTSVRTIPYSVSRCSVTPLFSLGL
jgi:hypothetical protein